MRTNYAWALAVIAALPAASCSCQTKTIKADAHLTPFEGSAADFGQICLEGSQDRTVTIRNNGGAPANLSWTVVGVGNDSLGPKMFTTQPEAGTAHNINAGGSLAITVTYHPSDSVADGQSQLDKTHSAFLHFSSDAKEASSKEFEVKLDGRTSPQQPQAIASLHCTSGDVDCSGGDPGACCLDVPPLSQDLPELGRTHLNRIDFKDTPTGASRSQKFDLANIGCGVLHVTGYTFVSDGASFCPSSSIVVAGLEQPLTLPGSVTGGQTGANTITVTFSPQDTCTLSGKLVLQTDDPNVDSQNSSQDYTSFNVQGTGAQPEVTALCNNLQNNCLFGEVATGDCKPQELHLSNHGSFPVTVTATDIMPGGAGTPEFTIEKIESTDCTTAARSAVTVPFVLAPSDGRGSCGPDEVFVSLNYCPGSQPDNQRVPDDDTLVFTYTEEGSGGGAVNVHLHGGSDPVLVVHPDDGSVPGTFGCTSDGDPPQFTPAAVVFEVPETLSCTSCDNTCQGSCTTDDDCNNGNGPCVVSKTGLGVCAGSEACITGLCTGNLGAKPVKICNEGKGNLVVNSIEITTTDDEPTTTFQVASVADCTNPPSPLKENDCCTFLVVAKADNTGGVSIGKVVIKSNDPLAKVPPAVDVCSKVPTHLPPSLHVDMTDGSGGTALKAGQWAYLDPSPTIFSPPTGSGENFAWSIVSAKGDSTNSRLPVMVPIGMDDPDKDCKPPLKDPGPGCFIFPMTVNSQPVAPLGKVLAFRPDVPGDYVFHVHMDDSTCVPPLSDDERDMRDGDFSVHVD